MLALVPVGTNGARADDTDDTIVAPIVRAPLTDEAPWIVGLKLPGAYGYCSGSVLAERWVLTAAHCLEGAPAMARMEVVHAPAPGERQTVYAGPARYHPHPGYSPSRFSGDPEDDFGLVELVAAGDGIDLDVTGRARLYQPFGRTEVWTEPRKRDREFTFIGWGMTDRPSDAGHCAEGTHGRKRIARKLVLSRGSRGTREVKAPLMESHACDGDSGSPFLLERDGEYLALAVFSGIKRRFKNIPIIGSETQRAGVVRSKLDWINRTAQRTDPARRMVCDIAGVADGARFNTCSMKPGFEPEPSPSPRCPPGQVCAEPGVSPDECRICIPADGDAP